MSRFLSAYPVIRVLLKRYQSHNIEYAAVAPFQTTFSTLFLAKDGYAVNMEQSVDRDRGRVDLFIQGLDFQHETLYPILVGEMKGGGRGPNGVENQVLDRALKTIDSYQLEGIYAFTSLGDSFRFWTVSATRKTLDPFGQDIPCGNRHAYIPLDSPQGDCIVDLTDAMKEKRPVCAAPVVPSQSVSVDYNLQSDQHRSPSTHYVQPYQTDAGASFVSDLGSHQAFHGYHDAEAVSETEAGPSQPGQSSQERFKQVTLEKRLLGGYKFAWKRGIVETKKDEWKKEGDIWTLKVKWEGYTIWGYGP